MSELKAMPIFFLDNQALLTKDAELVGNVVVSKVDPPQKFPVAAMIGQASVAGFDGMVVVQAGNAAIVVTVFEGHGKGDLGEIREIMTKKKPSKWPEWIHQYRIDVMALIQFMALYHAGEAGSDEMNPYSLLDFLATKGGPETAILRQALKDFCRAPDVPEVTLKEAFETAERMLLSWDN